MIDVATVLDNFERTVQLSRFSPDSPKP